MISFNNIEEITYKHMQKVKNLLMEDKSQIKKYKLEQAEIMKNLMLSETPSYNLEEYFKKFQYELQLKEQELQNNIKNAVIYEFELLKNEVSQKFEENFTMQPNNMINNMEMSNQMSNLSMNNYIPNATPNNNPINSHIDNNLLDSINERKTPMDQAKVMNDIEKNDIPVETKELDDWISEIKNLI